MKTILLLISLVLTAPVFAREKLDGNDLKETLSVFKIYELMHASFYNYDAKTIETSASDLATTIKKTKSKKLNEVVGQLPTILLKMKASNNREQNNELFDGVSSAFITLLTTYDLGSNYNAYSCPMVKKRWVQNSVKENKVANPYAPSMKRCGTKDTTF